MAHDWSDSAKATLGFNTLGNEKKETTVANTAPYGTQHSKRNQTENNVKH
jgi:hypothetical protein